MTQQYNSPLVSCIVCREIKSAKGIFSHFMGTHTIAGNEKLINAGKASKNNHETQKKMPRIKGYCIASCLINVLRATNH